MSGKPGGSKEKHEATGSPEYRAYRDARNRCLNPNISGYVNYGGRGIKFEFSSFREFISTIGKRPSPKCSLDRIDNDGPYSATNCRWATRSEQGFNRRQKLKQCSSRFVGVTRTKSGWAAQSKLNNKRIYLGSFPTELLAVLRVSEYHLKRKQL